MGIGAQHTRISALTALGRLDASLSWRSEAGRMSEGRRRFEAIWRAIAVMVELEVGN